MTKLIVGLAGNPNVGKTTVFNRLTGMRQHVGNWPGKTVSNASGICNYMNKNFLLIDLPGTYSLMSNSEEEEIARNFICLNKPNVTIVVLDATCLERNLNLLYQIMEITPNVIACVNLLDEAEKSDIRIIRPLMREGKLLTELLKRAQRERYIDISIEPLYVSRFAVFTGNFEKCSEEDIVYLVGTNNITLRRVFEILNIDELSEKYMEYLDMLTIDLRNITLGEQSVLDNVKELERIVKTIEVDLKVEYGYGSNWFNTK